MFGVLRQVAAQLAAAPRSDDSAEVVDPGFIPPVSISNLEGFQPVYVPLTNGNPIITTLTPADEFVIATTPLFLALAIGFVLLIGLGFLSLRKDWKYDQ